jgi:hypothetical protein
VSDRSTAQYDDLSVAPDPNFERALRSLLDANLRAVRTQTRPVPVDIDIELDVRRSPEPMPSRRDERGRSRRAVFAMAAAIVASVAVGVVVDQLVVDDSTDPPALTVPTPTTTPATIPTPTTVGSTTSTEPSFTADDVVAIKSLLWDNDLDISGYSHPAGGNRPARLDGATAEQLPACRPFVASVFESDQRPAAITHREFISQEDNFLLVLQYVAVFPKVEQATAMIDGMQEPAFLAECVPAYRASVPTVCCEDLPYWTPVFEGDELQAPTIDVEADDVWTRRWMGSWSGENDAAVYGPQDMVFAAVRVGRIVTLVNVSLANDGTHRASLDDFERIVQRAAARAAGAQAVS